MYASQLSHRSAKGDRACKDSEQMLLNMERVGRCLSFCNLAVVRHINRYIQVTHGAMGTAEWSKKDVAARLEDTRKELEKLYNLVVTHGEQEQAGNTAFTQGPYQLAFGIAPCLLKDF